MLSFPGNPSDPDLLPGAHDVAELDGPGGTECQGNIWDAALRAHLSIRNYGFNYSHYYSQKLAPLERDPFSKKLKVSFPTIPCSCPSQTSTTGPGTQPSCLRRHSALSRASSRHSGGKGCNGSDSDPEHGSADYSPDVRSSVLPASPLDVLARLIPRDPVF